VALLCQKKFPIDFGTSLIQAAQAFPVVAFAHKLEDNTRKIMEIAEAEITPDGRRRYRTLYNYNITSNKYDGEKFDIQGHFQKPEIMSDSLKRKLMQYGAPQDVLQKFLKKGRTNN
jgi:pilus assembly protein CpaF